MQATVCGLLIARLYEWGVRHVFGYPDDGTSGTFGALQCTGGKIEFVQARHEEVAAFMASAHAKFIGELGVYIAASGPGTTHLITGLYDARLDHMPVLAVTGQRARTAVGGHYQQEVNLMAMFRDVADAFVHQASMPAQVWHLLDRAVRIAIGQRRATALVLPNDLQEVPYTEPPRTHDTVHSGVSYSAPSVVPQAADLGRAADAPNSSHRMAMLINAGALGASAEVAAVAETLGTDVAKALFGRAVLPNDLPYVTGAIDLLSIKPSWEPVNHCDTLLVVGSGFPHTEFPPEEGQARGVQIGLDPGMPELRYPVEVDLVGDGAQTPRALLPLPQRRTGPYWLDHIACWNES